MSDTSRPPKHKPRVELPGVGSFTSDAGRRLGKLLARKQTHFLRGDDVVRVTDDRTLRIVKPVEIASDFEQVAELVKLKGGIPLRCACGQREAGLILGSQAFRDALPRLNVVSKCPVLVDRGDDLEVIVGYDEATGILAHGERPPDMSPDEAVRALKGLFKHFCFVSESDRSRAIAAVLTPALVQGGLLSGRAPIDLGQADSSQTGKGYRNKITAAVYGCVPQAVTQRRSGVGSLEEAFDSALISGQQFISLDNIRGQIDSPTIESFCTEDTYSARTAYAPQTKIDPRRFVVQLTSNKAEFVSPDFPNRTCCTRLLKQPAGFRFPNYPEGDLLNHVRANQAKYLGAVFRVIREWQLRGRRRSGETRHDFREWAQVSDWIVQTIFQAAPLMDGHEQAQRCMSSPASNWIRDAALAVVRQGRAEELLTTTSLLSVLINDGGVEIPGGRDLSSEEVRRQAAIQIGRKIGHAFQSGDGDVLRVDHITIYRESENGPNGKPSHKYRFIADGEQLQSQPPPPRASTPKATRRPALAGAPY